MSDESSLSTGQWCVLELMGRRRLIGYVSEVTFAGAPFVRIDVLLGEGRTTQYYSGASIYAITPVSEETARRAASLNAVAPISPWELPVPRVPEAVAVAATGYVQSDDDRAADTRAGDDDDDTGDLADSSDPYAEE